MLPQFCPSLYVLLTLTFDLDLKTGPVLELYTHYSIKVAHALQSTWALGNLYVSFGLSVLSYGFTPVCVAPYDVAFGAHQVNLNVDIPILSAAEM